MSPCDNQDKIWDAYQNDPRLQEMGCRSGGRVEFVARRIPVAAVVLNIGVGIGKLENLLVRRNIPVYSLDPSEATIRNIRAAMDVDEDRAKVGYSQKIPFADGTFDIVVMTEVLEHLSDDVLNETVREVRRVLKPGGKFIGTVPAEENLKMDLVVCPRCGEQFHRWGHQQSFSAERLKTVLGRSFSSVSVKRKHFSDYSHLNWKGRITVLLKMVQSSLDIIGSNQNFYFEAKKCA